MYKKKKIHPQPLNLVGLKQPSAHLPMQNSRNSTSSRSSTSTRPVMRPSARTARRNSSAASSGAASWGNRAKEAAHSSSAWRWRARVMSGAAPDEKRAATMSRNRASSSRSPAPVLTEIRTAWPAPSPSAQAAPSSGSKSILLATSSVSRLMSGASARASPGRAASSTTSLRSACAARARARRTPSSSMASDGARQPAGSARPAARAPPPLLLDGVGWRAQAGGVGQHHRVAAEIERHLDHVARGAGAGGGDRHLAPRQRVHQTRFAGIGRAENRHLEARTQHLAAAAVLERGPDLGREPRDAVGRLAAQIFRQALFGKVDLGFEPRLGLQQPLAPILIDLRRRARSLAQRLAALRRGFGRDQVGHAFGLGQIELAVQKGAAGELARLGQAQTRHLAQGIEQRRRHRAPAMEVELGHVLAGVARRRREIERDAA